MIIKKELTDYDVFPKVFCENTVQTIHIVPLGWHAAFNCSEEYTVCVCPLSEGTPWDYPYRNNDFSQELKPSANGGFDVTHKFGAEQEYFIRIMENGKRLVQFSVYAVKEDLCGRYPFRGDLHMHTRRSDGKEAPEIVAANYRRYGYDFLAITDHRRYYASLEAMNAFKDVKTDYTLVPGEEVHLPDNDVHNVNFGGTFSINGLLKSSDQIAERGESEEFRSLDGNCPPVMSDDEYRAEVNALIPSLKLPEEFPDKFKYASCVWIYNKIREAGGLAIFCHPYWISNVIQVPESFTDFLTANHPFDAFEVAGGESYYEQNGFQWAKYYEDREHGIIYPVVGSTDSHGSVHNDNKLVANTVVLAHKNERCELIDSIKKQYSVAVETVGEDKIIGEFRLVKYVCFLLKNYFPLHDELCFEEGRALKAYACGDKSEAKTLEAIYGRTQRLREKYFAF